MNGSMENVSFFFFFRLPSPEMNYEFVMNEQLFGKADSPFPIVPFYGLIK